MQLYHSCQNKLCLQLYHSCPINKKGAVQENCAFFIKTRKKNMKKILQFKKNFVPLPSKRINQAYKHINKYSLTTTIL